MHIPVTVAVGVTPVPLAVAAVPLTPVAVAVTPIFVALTKPKPGSDDLSPPSVPVAPMFVGSESNDLKHPSSYSRTCPDLCFINS